MTRERQETAAHETDELPLDEPAGRRPARERATRLPTDLGPRVAVAVPALIVAGALVYLGGALFAAALAVLAVLAVHELHRMAGPAPSLQIAASIAAAAAIVGAYVGDTREIVLVVGLFLPAALAAALLRPPRTRAIAAIALALLGVVWIGVGLAHGVLLRDLPNGAGLVLNVLLATFVGDTCAHLVGTAYGRTPLVPRVSPNKTVEGLVAGVAGGTLAVVLVAVAFQDWLSGSQAFGIGLAVALAAPAGDLLESLVKRDLDVKDSGRLFGPHGGVLDRIDAVLFAAVVGYYASVAVL